MGPVELNLIVRAVGPADLGPVRDICGWYAVRSVATFEESPRTQAHWSQHADKLARHGLPFLVAEADGAVAGYAYAGPWRPKPAYRSTAEDSVFVAPGRAG